MSDEDHYWQHWNVPRVQLCRHKKFQQENIWLGTFKLKLSVNIRPLLIWSASPPDRNMLDFWGFPMIFTILKWRFLHEKLIFFIQDFFLTRYDPIASISGTYNIRVSSAWESARILWTIPSEEFFRAKTFFWWDYSRYMTVYAPNLTPMKIWCYKCQKSKL